MKVICSKDMLMKSLNVAENVISTKNSISVLSNVLLEAKNGILKIVASETSLNFFSEIPAEVIEEGSILLYCNRLFNLIKKFNDTEIEITTDKDNIVDVKPKNKKNSDYKHKGIDSDKFPPIKIETEFVYFSIKQTLFTEMVKKTIFSVSTNDSNKKFISGILFEKSDDCIKMVSTDGKRLSFIKRDMILDNFENCSIIVPPKILNEVLKLCNNNGDVQIALNNKNISIKIDNFLFISNLLEGNFPPYQKVIPTEYLGTITINKKNLLESLDRISTMGDKETNKVIVSFFHNEIQIFAENITYGSGKEIVEVDYSGNTIEVALNLLYLIEFLNATSSENINVFFKDSHSTITLKQEDDNDYVYIMMPMTI